MDDDRNQLFRQFTRLLTGLQPRAFVMENVSGMVKGKMKLLFAEILAELKACGYRVSVRLLNAMYFGVPQSRQRLIFVGVREDLAAEPGHPGAWGHLVTVRDAFRCLHPQTFAPPARGQSFVLPYIRPGQQASKVVPKNVLAAFIPRLLNPKPMAYAATAPLVALGANLVVAFLVFTFGHFLIRVVGDGGAKGIGKVASLLLAAIAVMMIRSGIEAMIRAG